MNPCPRHIAEPLLEILKWGLLAIRAAGFANRGDLCAIHADHLHNLPELIEDYSEDRLLYYWQAERIGFMEKLNPGDYRYFVEPWSRLESIVAELDTDAKKLKEVAGTT